MEAEDRWMHVVIETKNFSPDAVEAGDRFRAG